MNQETKTDNSAERKLPTEVDIAGLKQALHSDFGESYISGQYLRAHTDVLAFSDNKSGVLYYYRDASIVRLLSCKRSKKSGVKWDLLTEIMKNKAEYPQFSADSIQKRLDKGETIDALIEDFKNQIGQAVDKVLDKKSVIRRRQKNKKKRQKKQKK